MPKNKRINKTHTYTHKPKEVHKSEIYHVHKWEDSISENVLIHPQLVLF